MAEGRVVDETMKKRDYELPEPITQRIQSFLTGKEAARTITLSKSWHKAYLTRPKLDFDEPHIFQSRDFWKSAKKTIQRYEDSNLKIKSFRLFLQYDNSRELASKLIVKALRLCPSHLSFELAPHNTRRFVVPREVFESENLVGLSVKRCGIDLGIDHNVRCYKLESLCLRSVETENDAVTNIISSCPLIRNLSLSKLFGKKEGYHSIPINLPKMQNLKSLTLDRVKLGPLFLGDKFPALKILTLDELFFGAEDLEIQSRSLVRLNLNTMYLATSMLKLDVPSIKKLVIESSSIPSVSLKSTSKEWEGSHFTFSLTDDNPLSNARFLALDELLTALSPSSNIYLSINGGCDKIFNYEPRDIRGLHKHRVENLTIDIQYLPVLNCYALFDGLFRFCSPKFITLHFRDKYSHSGGFRTSTNDFLSKRLVQGTKGVFSFPEHFLFGLNDLKEVYVQIFYDDVVVVEDLPWKPLIEVNEAASSEIRLEPKKNIRYKLVWKS